MSTVSILIRLKQRYYSINPPMYETKMIKNGNHERYLSCSYIFFKFRNPRLNKMIKML